MTGMIHRLPNGDVHPLHYIIEARLSFRISQSELARLANVSRFKICTAELGSTKLSDEEISRLSNAVEKEAERLYNASADWLGIDDK